MGAVRRLVALALLLVVPVLAGCAETFTPVSRDNSIVDYGDDVAFPEGWPEDFPLTDESVLLVSAAPDDTVSVILRSPESYDEVVAFYDQQLTGYYSVQSREGGNNATRWHLHNGGLVEVLYGQPVEIGIELPASATG